MKSSTIFVKTLKFVWLKLALGLATLVVSLLLLGLFLGIGMLFGSGGLGLMFLLWLAATGVVSRVINNYFGYMVKAGHVAVVAMAATTGQLPENQFAYAKQTVTGRFATSNVYFVVDKLVAGSVKQLQKGIGRVGSLLSAVPGMKAITSILEIFVRMSLSYVDECCLGYTFYKSDESAFKSAADGVVIYFQNWKRLLKNAAVMTAMVLAFTLLAWVLAFALFGGLASLLGLNGFVAALLALIVAIALKTAFVDSYMMVKMMTEYMQAATTTEITFDLYDKLCGLSRKFRELFEKGKQEEQPAPGAQAAV